MMSIAPSGTDALHGVHVHSILLVGLPHTGLPLIRDLSEAGIPQVRMLDDLGPQKNVIFERAALAAF